MRKLLVLLVALALPSSAVTTRYIAASAGTFSGGSVCNGHTAMTPATWNSTSESAGDISYICGALTASANGTILTFGWSGSSGNPITLIFDTGATLKAPYFGSTHGAIDGNGHTFLVVDGGAPCGVTGVSCNGIIQNTLNGTSGGSCPGGTCTNQQGTTGIQFIGSANSEIKNVGVYDLYDHTSSSDSVVDVTQVNAVQFGGANILIHDSKFHDLGWALLQNAASGGSGLQIYNNEIYNMAHGMAVGAPPSVTISSVAIYNNHLHDMGNWGTGVADTYHLTGVHGFSTAPGKIQNLYLHDNLFDGTLGSCCITGWVFLEASDSGTPWTDSTGTAFAWNNVFYADLDVPNGIVYIGDGTAHEFWNNTIIGPNGGNNGACLVFHTSATSVSIQNNTIEGCTTLVNGVSSSTFSVIDYNIYGKASGGNPQWQFGAANATSLSAWKTACSCDAHSLAQSPLTSAIADISLTTGRPSTGYAGALAGTNLSTSATGNLASLANDSSAGGTYVPVARPTGATAWDMGAFQLSSSTAPTVTTTTATSVLATTASAGGTVTSNGGSSVTSEGTCWGPTANPRIGGSGVTCTSDGTSTPFTSSLTGMTPATTVHYNAYAINAIGTGYGSDMSLTTINVPTAVTGLSAYITSTSFKVQGTVTSNGGSSVTAEGLCVGPSTNPRIGGSGVSCTSDGTSTPFVSFPTGQTSGATVHVASYATNAAGTGYGSDLAVTMLASGTATVYLRSSSPYGQAVIGASNATPPVIQTGNPHGLPATGTTCNGLSNTFCVTVQNLCAGPTGSSWASNLNGTFVGHYVDTTHFSLYDFFGNPIVPYANYVSACDSLYGVGAGAQWEGLVTPYVTGAYPSTYVDGANGQVMNYLTSAPTSVVVTGCPGACVATVGLSFNPLTQPIPTQVGDSFSILGTSSNALNTNIYAGGPSPAVTPYTGPQLTVASVSSSGVVSNTFTSSGLSNGTYGANMACGPTVPPSDAMGTTEDCRRISFLANLNSTIWNNMRFRNTAFINMDDTSSSNPAWKWVFDGGGLPQSSGVFPYNSPCGEFFIDPSNVHFFTVCLYSMKNIVKAGGVNWTGNSVGFEGGSGIFNQDSGYTFGSAGFMCFVMCRYAATSTINTLGQQLYNNIQDSSNISSAADADMASGNNYVLATGTAQNGSGTNITLAAGDPATADCTTTYTANSYCQLEIVAVTSGARGYGGVTAYNHTTKVATVASWAGTSPTTGSTYSVYATAIVSSTAAGGGATTVTVTGFGTTFNSGANPIVSGDEIIIANAVGSDWGNPVVSAIGSYVVTTSSDTSLVVRNSSGITASTTVPQIVYIAHQWKTGDVGLAWLACFWAGGISCQPNPFNGGGDLTANLGPPLYNVDSGNNAGVWFSNRIPLGIVLCPYYPGACTDLTTEQTWAWDYWFAQYWTYISGFSHSGGAYDLETIMAPFQGTPVSVQWGIPTYPDMNLHGQWMQDILRMKMYSIFPDFEFYGGSSAPVFVIQRRGDYTGVASFMAFNLGTAANYLSDLNFVINPTLSATKYFRSFLGGCGAGCNPYLTTPYWGLQVQQDGIGPVLYNDNRQPHLDFTAQPHQYHFGDYTNYAVAKALTGLDRGVTFRGDGIVSLTGWGGCQDYLFSGYRTWWSDHDHPQNGMLRAYSCGDLLGNDSNLPSDSQNSAPQDNEAVYGDTTVIGGVYSFQGGFSNNTPAESPVIQWWCQNRGTWDCPYGDQNSQAAAWAADMHSAYTDTFTTFVDRVIDSKATGADHVFLHIVSVVQPVANTVAKHVHMMQTPSVTQASYPTGTTSCPGSGGCASLNTNGRIVKEVEDGGTYGAGGGTIVANHGLLYWFGTSGSSADYVTFDGNTWSGSAGFSQRVTHGCGSGLLSTVTTCNLLELGKFMQSFADTTLTITKLDPDANWTGVQTDSSVLLGAINALTQPAPANFTTTVAAQYVFQGIAAGTYTVTINGTPVSGSPFTVPAGDNSIEFGSSTFGTVSFSGGGVPPPTMYGGSMFSGYPIIIH